MIWIGRQDRRRRFPTPRALRASFAPLCLLICLSAASAVWAADEADPKEDLAAAREHFQKGRVDESLEIYEELAQAKSAPVAAALGRADCLTSRGDLAEAVAVLEEALHTTQDEPRLWVRLAEIRLTQGDFAATEKCIEQALQLKKDLPAARLVRADLLTATGKLKEADEAYHAFVKLYNDLQPEDAETLLVIGHGAAQYARWHNGTQIFDFVLNTVCPDILKSDPLEWRAHLLAGSLLLEKYNRAQALPELKLGLKLNPRAAPIYAALAESAIQQHDLKEAEQFANRALEIDPHLVAVLVVKADLLFSQGDNAGTLAALAKAQAVNPHDEETLGRIAAVYLLQDGSPPPAELKELFDNLDNIAEAEFNEPSRFTKLTADVAHWNPHPGRYLAAAGTALEARWQFVLAERCYREAILAMPQLAEPKTALGMLCMRVGKRDEARQILDQALVADPYHVRVSNMRKVLSLLDSYGTLSTDHFVIRYDTQADKILARYIADYLEEVYPALVEQFGYEPPVRTQFELFHKSKGLSAHEWFSARMVGLPWIQTIGASTGMIVALASPTASEKPYNWARVVKHEFVHILTLQKTNFNIPHWYTEALAVMSEGFDRPEIWNQLLLERVPKGELMNLDTVNLGFIRPKSQLDWQMAYCQSQLYAQYMIDRFGPEKTSELLAAYGEHLTTDQAIPKVFGVEKQVFEKGYREYLNELVAKLRGSTAEPSLTPAQAEKAYRAEPDNPQAAARYAAELMKGNRRKLARELALAALKKNPKEPRAAIVMAQLELRSGDVESALGYLEPALDKSHPHPDVLDLLAQLRMKQSEFDKAAALYQAGLEIDPAKISWMKGLAACCIKSGKTKKLKAVLERLVQADAEDATVRKKLARMAFDDKQYIDAVRYGRLAIEVDVLDVETHKLLAEAYTALQQPAKAADEWGVVLELQPKNGEAELSLAQAEVAAGRKEAARDRLQKILKRTPENSTARKLLDGLK